VHIIVGLGNPEPAYKGTRHNIGFEAINKLAYDFGIGVSKKKGHALVGTGRIAGQPVVLAKPQLYMNRSGESIQALLRFYSCTPQNLIVIYDDTDFELGTVRIRNAGSAGGHNGMRDTLHHLGTDAFTRVRVGIGKRPPGWVLADYVLSRFIPEEHPTMIEGVTQAGDAVVKILADGANAAMNFFNQKAPQ